MDVKGEFPAVLLGDPDFATEARVRFENADLGNVRGAAEFGADGSFEISAEPGIGGGFADGHFTQDAEESGFVFGDFVLVRAANEIKIAIHRSSGALQLADLAGTQS